jgi:hypothetical protein
METLDELCAKCKCLREEEFNLLLGALVQEQKRREDIEQNEDWKNLCKQIETFTRKWGCITVWEQRGNMDNTLANLIFGNYTFPAFGEIQVE